MIGPRQLRALLGDAIHAHAEIVFPAVFLGFFVAGAIACIYRGRSRQLFVVAVVCLLATSSILALTVYPFTHAHRYSPPAEQTEEKHDIRLVDESGAELLLDRRAVLPIRDSLLAEHLVHEWDDETRLELAAQILADSEEHRQVATSRIPRLAHPPPSAGYYWDRSTLEEYDGFESVRVYRVEWQYEPDGHAVEEKTETCVLEIDPAAETISETCADV